ncbi:hypothetical protein BDV27DRAFT_20539 [Aspergillus caelatus]|uniref:Uncharacterized protein n=1 Tax=Aspergillus caelatus TaxID=61420 RepID=A0A5N7AGS5_9EURO|nr:uncharacterized protein BDV27DRAFT_20539 [Aspergillus caelatus]KAE8369074.1 hypothetical protein BDV27DRAFT_20539 [Aspergillus caelatus]
MVENNGYKPGVLNNTMQTGAYKTIVMWAILGHRVIISIAMVSFRGGRIKLTWLLRVFHRNSNNQGFAAMSVQNPEGQKAERAKNEHKNS